MATTDVTVPIPEPLSSDQQRTIPLPSDKWTNSYALQAVKSDWAYAESYRVNAHDWRYRNADELYLAWSGQQYWEGTRVPRSSLGQYVVFSQVEAMLPKLVSSVTSTDSYHFSADQPGDQDTDLIVTAWGEMVVAQLGESHWREQVRLALKNMAIYGNGVLEVGVEEYQDENITFSKSVRASKLALVNHPTMGPVPVPTETKESFARKVIRETKLRPYVRYVSVKDIYVDPNLENSCLQNASHFIKRTYMRAVDIKALKDVKDFVIPDDLYLTNLSHAKSTAQQDVTKLAPEMFRYNMWNPSLDYTSDPAQKRIAVVEYTTKDRKVWWLQGNQDEKSIIYNRPNRYGQINYFSVPYADVPDRWNAQSVADVAEGEQRLQQAIINGRVDELALALHPPMVKRRGVTVPWYQLKRKPGGVVEVENPKEDVIQSEISNVTQQAFVEVAASENRVQKITGLTDLAALGTPSSGGNSANRTATGINTQAGATQDRMKYMIENVEDSLIEPVVNFVIFCNRKFMDMGTASNWLKMDPRFAQLDPEKVMNTKVSAECRASIKLAGRAAFMQTLPLILQTYLNPEFLQLTSKVNQKTLDPDSLEDTLWDAMNYRPRKPWFVPMTQQQIQAQSQPPADVLAKLQMLQQQIESDQTIEDKRGKLSLVKALIAEIFPMHAKMAELDDKHVQTVAQMALDKYTVDNQPEPSAEGGAN